MSPEGDLVPSSDAGAVADNSIPSAQLTQSPSHPVLNYRSAETRARGFGALNIIWPFAAGAMLPFATAAIAYGEDMLWFGLALTWGQAAALLIAIKIRGNFVKIRPVRRPWWMHLLAGVVNTAAMWEVLQLTTARYQFWPMLGLGGSVAAAIFVAAVLAAGIGTFLTPVSKGQ
jgi:hypothetical protein